MSEPQRSKSQIVCLVSGATATPRSETSGHLVVPKQGNDPLKLNLRQGRWAIDNGAFSGFDEGAFVRLLERCHGIGGCLFVSCPDVVGDAGATSWRWAFWARLIHGLGYPVAFVAQDGLTPDRVPWGEFECLFIGGSTKYKESADVRSLMAYANARGVWTHWGRVNGQRRYELALKSGCDSFDGSGFSRYPDTNIPKVAEWHDTIRRQPELQEVSDLSGVSDLSPAP